MYKPFIKRRLSYLLERKNITKTKLGRSRVSFFSDIKRKEIVVWMWLQQNKDKDQITEAAMDKFNLSEQDAENIFYEAYPDGLSPQEEEMVDDLDKTLNRVVDLKPSIITDTTNVLMGTAPEECLTQYTTDPEVQNQIKIVVGTLLKSRNLI
jgi:hypothetical protein